MHTVFRVIILSVAVITVGCDRASETPKGETIAAVATAETDGSDNIVTRAPTADELAQLSAVSARREAVDRQYPPASAPLDIRRFKAVRMDSSGALVLEDGRVIALDGVSCTQKGYEDLSRYFLDPDSSLAVVETGPTVDHRTPAEVWVIEKLDGGGTSMLFPVEAGLTTGWCDPKPSSTSPHNGRFAALAVAFAAERKAYAESAP